MSQTEAYDKAKYHMTGLAGEAPSWEHASASMLFFLRWLIDNNLVSEFFLKENSEALAEYRAGTMSLFSLFERQCDLVLASDMLSDEGNAFAQAYFDYERGGFIEDLYNTLKLSKKSYPLYTEEAYVILKAILDSRYNAWKAGNLEAVKKPKRPKKWWQFWK